MGFKYIVIRDGDRELPIIFPDQLVHSVMFAAMKRYFVIESEIMGTSAGKTMRRIEAMKAVSAGELEHGGGLLRRQIRNVEVGVEGPVDAALIDTFPWCHGIVVEEEK